MQILAATYWGFDNNVLMYMNFLGRWLRLACWIDSKAVRSFRTSIICTLNGKVLSG
jgi:hypothetical protein